MVKRWIEAILQNVAATVLIALVPGAVATYLTGIGSRWATPMMVGILAAALSSLTLFILRKQMGLPIKRVVPNGENIEGLVRAWLNQFRVGVKDDPTPDAHFRVVATMDSGISMTVGRAREYFKTISSSGQI